MIRPVRRHTVRETRALATRVTLALLVLACATTWPGGVGVAGDVWPDVNVVLVAEIQDTVGWLTLHQEVLATPSGTSKILRATLPARTGGSRSIDIDQPRFAVDLATTGGNAQVKVSVVGKISPTLALALLTPFQDAALEVQSGLVVNELWLTYGLSTVSGRLLELHFDRP
jgi:hypothetical protein